MDFESQDKRLLIIKFGGRSLSDGAKIRKCAEKVAGIAYRDNVVVVVSAMGDQTSQLISLAHDVTDGNPTAQDTVSVASFGEMISASLFSAALESLGCRSEAILPSDTRWPVIASESNQTRLSIEKINEDRRITIHDAETRKRIDSEIKPMIEQGITPVVCGFLATDPIGNLTTLGRGGSDTTAFILGKFLDANEVIIVTDQKGVLKADPNSVNDPDKISVITTEQLDSMARSGARVLHPHSLVHKTPDMKARVVHYDEPDLTSGGTQIEGFLRAILRATPHPLALLSVVGDEAIEEPELLSSIVGNLTESVISIQAVAVTPGYIGVFVPEEQAERAYHGMHDVLSSNPKFKSLALRKGIARVTISSPKFQDETGVLALIGRTLAEKEINIIDLLTLQGDISVFVDWNDRETVIRVLRRLAVSARLDEVISGR